MNVAYKNCTFNLSFIEKGGQELIDRPVKIHRQGGGGIGCHTVVIVSVLVVRAKAAARGLEVVAIVAATPAGAL